ncbi:TetR/AcrR family transcriptional regulator [Rhizobium anhuiense]|uniref:TetR/AcrR family transcriptional regulator n=1 Tax=Rhizobium anhuiense TaxID=1184720 RepID=UPI0020CE42D5|nr:TetR/AcrR family transcriptional regulator [Rhizobium anhuiense]UTS88149.1 TetR/AcrR family transcriptional regulator [Rhizobium anhuiense bv. trifolii]
MDGQSATRERLISEGMRQLLAHGYDGVGIGPILKAVDVPKGSFYYFFQSKDDFVVAVVEAYEEKYRQVREKFFTDMSLRPLARLDAYFAALEQEYKAAAPYAGCIYGMIAQSAAGRSAVVLDALAASFERWEKSIQGVLAAAQQDGDIDSDENINDLTASIVDAYEGALIRAKAKDGVLAFTRFREIGLKRLISPTKLNVR